MIAINPTGGAASLTPGVRGSSGSYTADVYLMTGDVPSNDILESLSTASAMITAYAGYAYKFSGLTITTNYNYTTNERTFKKTPVDALDFTPLISGEVKWAAIVFSGEKIIFTDSIGNWDNDDAVITLEKLVCTANENNVLKDINLVIREKSTYELNPNGIF